MTRSRVKLAGAAFLIWAACAGPGLTSAYECVLEHYPQDKRERILAASDADIDAILDTEFVSTDDAIAAANACGLPISGDTAVGVIAYQWEVAAGHWLMRHYGKSEADVDAAWRLIETDVMAAPGQLGSQQHADVIGPARQRFMTALGMPRADLTRREVAWIAHNYVISRERRQRLEPAT